MIESIKYEKPTTPAGVKYMTAVQQNWTLAAKKRGLGWATIDAVIGQWEAGECSLYVTWEDVAHLFGEMLKEGR